MSKDKKEILAYREGRLIDQSWIEKALNEEPTFKATPFDLPSPEELTNIFAEVGKAGATAAQAARSLSAAFGTIDYAAIERRIFDSMAGDQLPSGALLNPAEIYGPGEWRSIGKQRARTLRQRGKLVERTGDGWRWWRTPDPYKVTAAELFGIPYAQVQPHHRKRAKVDTFAQMYSTERYPWI